jgi:hypothetical protein
MPVTPVTVYTVTCDADTCTNVLGEDDDGTLFPNPAELPATARAHGWTVIGNEYLCPTRNQAHQELVDRAMPPEPVFQAPGQLALDGDAPA